MNQSIRCLCKHKDLSSYLQDLYKLGTAVYISVTTALLGIEMADPWSSLGSLAKSISCRFRESVSQKTRWRSTKKDYKVYFWPPHTPIYTRAHTHKNTLDIHTCQTRILYTEKNKNSQSYTSFPLWGRQSWTQVDPQRNPCSFLFHVHLRLLVSLSWTIITYFVVILLHLCVCVCTYECHAAHVEVRGQLKGVSSLSFCGFCQVSGNGLYALSHLFCPETESHHRPGWPRTCCIQQVCCKLPSIFLPLPLKGWEYRFVPLFLAIIYFIWKLGKHPRTNVIIPLPQIYRTLNIDQNPSSKKNSLVHSLFLVCF